MHVWVHVSANHRKIFVASVAYSDDHKDRTALKRQLADIEAGKVDTVVVYKIDCLTWSLTDFSRMIEVFEHHGVSFVSVTRQFNATTFMGRLMLNILLSFDSSPSPLQLALARGPRWLAMLESGEANSMKEIARRKGIDDSYVRRIVNLTTLASDIVVPVERDPLAM